MNEINVYLMDLSFEGNTSGVNRYLSIFTDHLIKSCKNTHVYRIKLFGGRSVLFYQENETESCTEIIIPLPQQAKEIIGERYWLQKYNAYAFSLIRHLFENKPNRIIHIHTLNLIALATYIKSQFSCKIITHLHCIPWKDLFNKNPKKFNQLYAGYYLEDVSVPRKELFFTNNCEWESYTAADRIICVTQCAKNFLEKIMNVPPEKIRVISNGIQDLANGDKCRVEKRSSGTFQCLFVGVLTESKGIFYILKALRKVQMQGYRVCLNMAGNCSAKIRKQIIEEYRDLQVNLLGRISFEELQNHYRESDIGIIASLQEQCSYAAIEMAMFGLPLVTTAVDGLDEMFTDGVNSLKVNILFSKVFGLSADVNMMADQIITLIENEDLRNRLSVHVRQLYQDRFNLKNMMKQTATVYQELSGNFEEMQQSPKRSILFCMDTMNSGGAEKVLLKILEYLNYDQFQVDLLVIHNYGVYFDKIPAQVNRFTLKEERCYRFKKYDVEVAFQEGLSTKYIAQRKSDAIKIAWVHCDFLNHHWTTGFYRNTESEAWCYSQMDRIVCVSQQSLSNFNPCFPQVQTAKQVIRNLIDREEIMRLGKAAPVQKNKFTLCCIGRLVESKAYRRLIPILNRLIIEGFDFECWILGEGEQQIEIETLIEQYSLSRVVFLKGFHEIPYPYLEASDLFVLASYTESYSLVLCEALCLGKPILVTQVSGAREIVDDCGLIVPQDEQSIYEGLKKLIEDKNLRESLGKKAFARSKSLFDCRKTMQEISDLLKNENKV
jgi:glycosyltransferase involved in cell wall biosynthesis